MTKPADGAGQRYQRRWELSHEAFEALLAWLDPDRNVAGARYQRLWDRLTTFFESRGVEEAEALADETLDRVARKLEKGEIVRHSMSGPFCFGVARNVLREYWKARRRQQIAQQLEPPPATTEPNEDEARLLDCLRWCLERMAEDQRALILDYYGGESGTRIAYRRGLAQRLGITMTALRLRACRLRVRLEASVNDRLVEMSGNRNKKDDFAM